MSIDRILSIIAIMVSCVAVPASGYLSYRYAVKGEKRKEWNALAVPIRDKLIAQIDAILHGEYVLAEIRREDILKFNDLRLPGQCDDLLLAFDEFEKSHSFEEVREIYTGRYLVVGDTSQALAASKRLLSYIERK